MRGTDAAAAWWAGRMQMRCRSMQTIDLARRAESSCTDVYRVSELLFWCGSNTGLFNHVLKKLYRERYLSYCPLQLFCSTQVFAQSTLLSKSHLGSASGRAKLELALKLLGQQIEYGCSLFSLSLSFKIIKNPCLQLFILHQRNIFLEMSWKLMCPYEKCGFWWFGIFPWKKRLLCFSDRLSANGSMAWGPCFLPETCSWSCWESS